MTFEEAVKGSGRSMISYPWMSGVAFPFLGLVHVRRYERKLTPSRESLVEAGWKSLLKFRPLTRAWLVCALAISDIAIGACA